MDKSFCGAIFASLPGGATLMQWHQATHVDTELGREACRTVLHSFTCLLKKDAQPKSWGLSFIWGPTEDYSPEDSLSDSSEELLGRGKVSYRI